MLCALCKALFYYYQKMNQLQQCELCWCLTRHLARHSNTVYIAQILFTRCHTNSANESVRQLRSGAAAFAPRRPAIRLVHVSARGCPGKRMKGVTMAFVALHVAI